MDSTWSDADDHEVRRRRGVVEGGVDDRGLATTPEGELGKGLAGEESVAVVAADDGGELGKEGVRGSCNHGRKLFLSSVVLGM